MRQTAFFLVMFCISYVVGPVKGYSDQETGLPRGYIKGPHNEKVLVFIHGVFGGAEKTWTNSQTKAYWPNLIGKDKDFEHMIYML